MGSKNLTWSALQPYLLTASEQEVKRMLLAEANGKQRAVFLMRLYGRYSKLRREREMAELFSR